MLQGNKMKVQEHDENEYGTSDSTDRVLVIHSLATFFVYPVNVSSTRRLFSNEICFLTCTVFYTVFNSPLRGKFCDVSRQEVGNVSIRVETLSVVW